ncbi:MAG: hypothetical protein WC700_17285 [Gemmatimonadaceae bacterium]|jgi:hypothetical protein
MPRSRYISCTADELIAHAHEMPVRYVYAPALHDEIAGRIEAVAPFCGKFAEGYRSALEDILDMLEGE